MYKTRTAYLIYLLANSPLLFKKKNIADDLHSTWGMLYKIPLRFVIHGRLWCYLNADEKRCFVALRCKIRLTHEVEYCSELRPVDKNYPITDPS